MKSSCRGSNPNNGLVWKRLNRRYVVCVGFASALATFGHAAMSASPLSGAKRKTSALSEYFRYVPILLQKSVETGVEP